jgi:transcriptional regulator with XRE-family HTH domain
MGWPMRHDEPNDVEVRARLRAWLRYYRDLYGWSQRELAQALTLSEATISNLLRNLEDPGLTCLVKMHFRLGADVPQMLRSDPPVVDRATRQAKKRAT